MYPTFVPRSHPVAGGSLVSARGHPKLSTTTRQRRVEPSRTTRNHAESPRTTRNHPESARIKSWSNVDDCECRQGFGVMAKPVVKTVDGIEQ